MGSWALRLFSKGKPDRPEINNSPSTSAEVKKECDYTLLILHAFMAWSGKTSF